jgi:hypothetical protein
LEVAVPSPITLLDNANLDAQLPPVSDGGIPVTSWMGPVFNMIEAHEMATFANPASLPPMVSEISFTDGARYFVDS